MEFLPENFVPQNYIHCMKCGKHFMFCACQGLGQSNLIYVMDPIPDDLTTMQRIQRWAQLVQFHPVLGVFDAPKFVNDLPPNFPDALRAAKPVVQRLMDNYKVKDDGLRATWRKLGILSEDEFEQSCKDVTLLWNIFSTETGAIQPIWNSSISTMQYRRHPSLRLIHTWLRIFSKS
jgi:hypothetical protein